VTDAEAMAGRAAGAARVLFRPVETRKVFEEAVDQIVEAIQLGALRVGDRLPPERSLAEELAISRPSVREAIKLLAAAGVLEVRHGGGTYVASDLVPATVLRARSRSWLGNLGALLELRRLIEPQAAQLAGMYGTEADFDAMQRTIDRQIEVTDDREAFFAGDVQFHLALVRAAGNPPLVTVAERIMSALQVARDMRYRRGDHAPEDSIAIHEQTLAAVARRDPGEIARVMEEHLAMLERVWEEETGRRLRRLPDGLAWTVGNGC
jgi:GntR family transcriptional repressor for pyruvate dehydrogenase complex